MELKKTANRREQLLGALVIVGILIMFVRVVYGPKKDFNAGIKVKRDALKAEKESLEQLTKVLTEKMAKTESTNTFDRLSTKLEILKGEKEPLAKETSALLAHITGKPFLKGVVLKEVSDQSPKTLGGYKSAAFFLNAEGSFSNIVRYMERVEQLPALLTIDDVSLQSITVKSKQLSAELTGTLFALGDIAK